MCFCAIDVRAVLLHIFELLRSAGHALQRGWHRLHKPGSHQGNCLCLALAAATIIIQPSLLSSTCALQFLHRMQSRAVFVYFAVCVSSCSTQPCIPPPPSFCILDHQLPLSPPKCFIRNTFTIINPSFQIHCAGVCAVRDIFPLDVTCDEH